MSTSKSDIEVLTQDWVQKLHFENKVDLNLQIAVENESTKIEVGDLPMDLLPKFDFSSSSSSSSSPPSTKNSDSYLQSILSSPSSPATNTSSNACTGSSTCACYKCQRQRRRAGIGRNAINTSNRSATTTTSRDTTEVEQTRTTTHASIKSTSCSPTSMSAASASVTSRSESFTKMSPTTTFATSSPPTPIPSPSPQQQDRKIRNTSSDTSSATTTTPKRSNTLRKTPTLKSYEKHMPKPAYSQKESIYRIEQEAAAEEKRQNEKKSQAKAALAAATLEDNYKMAWKEDGTGDDLLTSLVTFQTIFEEKGTGNEGLSDLLEQRAQELKYQKLREQQQEKRPEEELPPRRSDCLTLSYRNGPKHNPLTLYHTMKMHGEYERMGAYEIAFKHVINSNSGLRSWIKKSRVAPTRETSKLIQPARKPTVKRSLLHPLGNGRRNKSSEDGFLIWSASSDNLNLNSNGSKKSIDVISSPIIPLAHTPAGGGMSVTKESNNNRSSGSSSNKNNKSNSDSELTDVLSAAQALLPNQQLAQQQQQGQQQKANINRVPYEHIDTPSRPRPSNNNTSPPSTSPSTPDFKDTSSISSAESASGTSSKPLKSRTGRLFSSLGRKTSMRSYSSGSGKASSIRSLEKIDSGNEDSTQSHEKVLDDLCRILPHIERSRLEPYVCEANDDYMNALQLCKAAVISGKLS